MKWIKTTLLLVTITAASLLLSTTVHSQEDSLKRSPEMRAKAMTEKMKTKLVLTDEQYSKVYDLNVLYAKKNEEIINGGGSKLSKFKSLKSGNESKTKEMKGILTSAQFKDYEEMQKEMKDDARAPMKNRKS